VDLNTLTGRHELDYSSVRTTLDATTRHRGVSMVPLSDVVGDFATVRQTVYGTFRTRLGPDGQHLPAGLRDVVLAVEAFVDPLVAGDLDQVRWVPSSRRWELAHH
jgi:hypothetical protein